MLAISNHKVGERAVAYELVGGTTKWVKEDVRNENKCRVGRPESDSLAVQGQRRTTFAYPC